jgi:hypothetical protein
MSEALTPQKSQVDYILLDGSGSMATKWAESKTAIAAYIQTLSAEHIQSHIYFHLFADNFAGHNDTDICAFDGPISDWPNISGLKMPLAGGTALYDAVHIMALRIRDHLDWEPGHILIVTDGEEASSKFTDLTQAKSMLDWLKAKGWQITFIGADFSNSKLASSLGADKTQMIGTAKAQLSNMAKTLGEKRVRHARTGQDISFNEDEQQQFGGYLSHSS